MRAKIMCPGLSPSDSRPAAGGLSAAYACVPFTTDRDEREWLLSRAGRRVSGGQCFGAGAVARAVDAATANICALGAPFLSKQ